MKDAGNGNGNAAAGAAGSGSGSGGANHLLVGRWCGTFIEWQDTVCTTPRHRYDGDGADDDDDDAPCQGGRGARHAALCRGVQFIKDQNWTTVQSLTSSRFKTTSPVHDGIDHVNESINVEIFRRNVHTFVRAL
jgi:hypothetical protein